MCIHQTQTSTTAGWKNSNETFSLSSHCIYIQRTFSCGGEQLVGLSVWSFAWVARCEQLFPVHTRSHERAFKLCGKIVRKSSKVHAKQRNSIVNINLHTTKCIPLRKKSSLLTLGARENSFERFYVTLQQLSCSGRELNDVDEYHLFDRVPSICQLL